HDKDCQIQGPSSGDFIMNRRLCGALAGLLLTALMSSATAEDKKSERVFTDPAKAGHDFAIQGEYEGEMTLNAGKRKLGAQVIAQGDGKFAVHLLPGGLPGDGWDGKATWECKADTKDNVTLISGGSYKGEIGDG